MRKLALAALLAAPLVASASLGADGNFEAGRPAAGSASSDSTQIGPTLEDLGASWNDRSRATSTGTPQVWSSEAFASVTAVPEPETYALLIAGLGAIGVAVRRRRPR